MAKDPVETTEKYLSVIDAVNKEADDLLASQGISKTRGYVHKFWPLKKKILKEKYDIDWKSPAELNPKILFD